MTNSKPNNSDEVQNLQQQVARYREFLECYLTESWEKMTPEDLEKVIAESRGIEDILADLERAA
jgi:3-methyladenine DNA glycosylase Tag